MTRDLLRDDEGDIRIMGSPVFIQGVIEHLADVLDVSYDGNLRANRDGTGHRAHLHARLHNSRR